MPRGPAEVWAGASTCPCRGSGGIWGLPSTAVGVCRAPPFPRLLAVQSWQLLGDPKALGSFPSEAYGCSALKFVVCHEFGRTQPGSQRGGSELPVVHWGKVVFVGTSHLSPSSTAQHPAVSQKRSKFMEKLSSNNNNNNKGSQSFLRDAGFWLLAPPVPAHA